VRALCDGIQSRLDKLINLRRESQICCSEPGVDVMRAEWRDSVPPRTNDAAQG
jgi:hypothetical protein